MFRSCYFACVKYLVSISLLLIYLTGSFQASWVLVDFYWNRDDYTQKYCQFLDEGMTQCRASCYLQDLLEEQQNNTSDAKIVSTQKVKIIESTTKEEIAVSRSLSGLFQHKKYLPSRYHFDFYPIIFHPPKV